MTRVVRDKERGAGPRVLAIETSSRVGSLALAVGPEVVAVAEFRRNLRHVAELLPAMDRATAKLGWRAEDLDEVYVSAGPGSFTGLRIGITVAKTLAMACPVRLVAVGSIEVIAANAPPEAVNVGVVLDAKRKQVFAGRFQRQGERLVPTLKACLTDPSKFVAESPKPLLLLGEGVKYHGDALKAEGVEVAAESLCCPGARAVCKIGWEMGRRGEFSDPASLAPTYLRVPEAQELWNKRHGGTS